MSNFEQQFLQHLTAIQAALGGGNVALTEPRSFQSDALLMLAAIALAADGAGTTAEWSGISGDLVDQDELNTALASKQDTPVDYLTDIINRPDLSVFDNVDTHPNLAAFPATGDAEKIYIAADTNTPYRWTGSAYASIATVNDTLAAIGLLNSGQGFLYRALPLGTWELAAIALNTLTDTDVGAPQAGEILEYDGSNWVNVAPSSSGGGPLATGEALITGFGIQVNNAHGLGNAIKYVRAWLECVSPNRGYATGDRIHLPGDNGIVVQWDNNFVRCVTANTVFFLDRSTKNVVPMSGNDWKVVYEIY